MSVGTVIIRPTSDYEKSANYLTGSYADVDEVTLNTGDKVTSTYNSGQTYGYMVFGFPSPSLPTGAIATKVTLHAVLGGTGYFARAQVRVYGLAGVMWTNPNSESINAVTEFSWEMRTADNGGA
jgi:hypothetical protein